MWEDRKGERSFLSLSHLGIDTTLHSQSTTATFWWTFGLGILKHNSNKTPFDGNLSYFVGVPFLHIEDMSLIGPSFYV